jgi:carboxymethylenebutenolidase
LNDTVKAFCTRLAESGLVAFAPDLYHGKVADTMEGAEVLGQALDANHLQAKAEIAEATRFLDERASLPRLAPRSRHSQEALSFPNEVNRAAQLAGVGWP